MERKFRKRVKDGFSYWVRVSTGVPQRSVLGPLLFLVYMYESSKGGIIPEYAYDDAKIIREVRSYRVVKTYIETLAGSSCGQIHG